MALVDDYTVLQSKIAGVPVTCTTYKIGSTYHCVISDDSPGVNVARSSGPTFEAAVISASHKARQMFTNS